VDIDEAAVLRYQEDRLRENAQRNVFILESLLSIS
jgi:hypothetical protein